MTESDRWGLTDGGEGGLGEYHMSCHVRVAQHHYRPEYSLVSGVTIRPL